MKNKKTSYFISYWMAMARTITAYRQPGCLCIALPKPHSFSFRRSLPLSASSRRLTVSRLSVGGGKSESWGREERNMSSEGKKVVCVTGASGFIASWVVKILLERGYIIRATVRSLGDPAKTDHLHALEGANERLQIVEANLLEHGSFDAAVKGCDCVFHTASPFLIGSKNPQVEIIDPAVKGTLNVLQSCAKASVRRVVLTSSIAAIVHNNRLKTPDVMVDETWYSDADYCVHNKRWYQLSKLLAEKAAWEFAEKTALDLITINPAMVIGTLLQPTLNTSCARIRDLMNGSSVFPNMTFGWVSVKDVAEAHVLAYEAPSANGRYILAESVLHISEVIKILSEIYPGACLPAKCADDEPLVPKFKVSRERAENLGVKFTPTVVVLRELVESLISKNMLKLENNDELTGKTNKAL